MPKQKEKIIKFEKKLRILCAGAFCNMNQKAIVSNFREALSNQKQEFKKVIERKKKKKKFYREYYVDEKTGKYVDEIKDGQRLKIEKKEDEFCEYCSHIDCNQRIGYNQALKDILKAIEDL